MKTEVIENWIQEAYGIAKAHGFHDQERGDNVLLMLIVTEISEAVEADRKNKHPRDLRIFKNACADHSGKPEWENFGFSRCFGDRIKDTLEDELADIVIRCCDFLGCHGRTFQQSYRKPFEPLNRSHYTFADEAWYWVWMLVQQSHSAPTNVAGLLLTVCDYCETNNIDIVSHVEWKMKYNRTRPKLHGKAY